MFRKVAKLYHQLSYLGVTDADSYLSRFRKRVINRTYIIIGMTTLLIASQGGLKGGTHDLYIPLGVGLLSFLALSFSYLNWHFTSSAYLTFFFPSLLLLIIIFYGPDLHLEYTISLFLVFVFIFYDDKRRRIINVSYLLLLQIVGYYYTNNYTSPFRQHVDSWDSLIILLGTTLGLALLINQYIWQLKRLLGQQQDLNRDLNEKNVMLEKIVEEKDRLNVALSEKTRELTQSNEFLESYTYIASHDLKTPIRSISSFAKLLQKKLKTNEDPDVKDYLNFISTGTKQLHNIVDGIIENAMSNRSNLSYEMTDCTRLLQEIEQKMEVRLHHINGQLRYDRLPVVPADKNMLAKAFYYLIDNGFKYNHDENPQVRVTHRQSDGKHEFAVSDNGIGIPNRFRKDIFKMFKKLHPQQEYEGSGVGLALCKKIIELHGGKLWLDIKTKHGSTFYFSLPLSGKAPSKNPL